MDKNNRLSKTRYITVMALLAAAVIVLQLISGYIKIGPVNVTLVMVPIVIGGILFGVRSASVLGFMFGLFTYIFCVLGLDPGGSAMFALRPFITAVVCFGKSMLAGALSALVYKGLNKVFKSSVAPAIFASAICPLVNTSVFVIMALIFYKPMLIEWAGGDSANLISYIFVSIVGVNFLVEMLVNVVICPIVSARLLKMKWYKRLFGNK